MDTKKLRQKILDLAIHGKLVPQDPNDEPASVLLERIRAEKERLIKEGKIKKSKASKTADKPHYENVPFEIPSSWECVNFGSICKKLTDGSHNPPPKQIKGYAVISAQNIKNGEIVFTNKDRYTDEKGFQKENPRTRISRGDIILGIIGGSIGNVGIYEHDEPVIAQRSISIIDTYISNLYCFYLLQSQIFQSLFIEKSNGNAQAGVYLGELDKMIIPLPPLKEQQRIIAEIECWFSLIKKIEQGKVNLQSSIKQAKNKILDLAIHGKLVPQDSSDEPASELLKRINPKAEITCDNGQYGKIPENWCLTRVKDVFSINPRNKVEGTINAGFVPMANICDGYSNKFTYEVKEWKDIKSGFTHFANGDIAVAKISPCLENRKSVILSNLPNGIGAGTTELHVFRPLCVLPSFGLWFFKSDYFINKCIGTFNGVVGQQRVGKNVVEEILFPLPPLEEQKRIVNAIEKAFAKLDSIMESL